MFFYFSKLLAFLINPLFWAFSGVVGALLTRCSKVRYRLLVAVALWLWVLGNPWITNEVFLWWETPPMPFAEIQKGYQVAIVLTGVTQDSKSPKDRVYFMRGADRLLYAIRLYKENKIKKIVISGAYIDKLSPFVATEANSLRSICKMAGIPKEDILTEERSMNTYQNAVFTAKLLKEHRLDHNKCILVTSAFHMPRAVLCFRKQGIEVLPFAADFYSEDRFYDIGRILLPSTTALDRWGILFKEWVGIATYWLMGYI
ncbi:MAG: YdcF family protein [Cytophagales bacterium]|nr:YdcF family protein [Bernardetiaceae bacterium]MDW8211700.1 YdcF family protein [Cytophagales bacterium]